MTRLFVIMLLVSMSFSGIAQAEEKVFVEGIGMCNKTTANFLNAVMAKRRDEALAQYEKSKQANSAEVAIAQDSELTKKQQPEDAKEVVVEMQVNENTVQDVPREIQPTREAVADQKIWGSFPELSLWTGAWMNPKADTQGVWMDLKYLQWFTKFEQPENYGVGARLRGDYGWKSGSNADWGYIAPGVAAGYYRGLGLRNSFETDAALLYRFDMNRKDGLMPTGHVEFNHILGYKDRLIFQVDGNYFPHDSWLGPGIYWEHKLDKDWKVIAGAGASLSWLDGDYLSGFAPSVKVKYKNKYTVGLTANLFTGVGSFFGVIAAYESTPDISTWYAEYNQKTISLKQGMKQDQQNEGDSMGIKFKNYNEMEKENEK
ncbi:MAG: hypothetical protein HGA36_04270 [Candidatus Moranbacteria bacterium]|nr:hypothetical protein [Candidatus Moranbacteria bacterium]